jgi:hypothetical protein
VGFKEGGITPDRLVLVVFGKRYDRFALAGGCRGNSIVSEDEVGVDEYWEPCDDCGCADDSAGALGQRRFHLPLFSGMMFGTIKQADSAGAFVRSRFRS